MLNRLAQELALGRVMSERAQRECVLVDVLGFVEKSLDEVAGPGVSDALGKGVARAASAACCCRNLARASAA